MQLDRRDAFIKGVADYVETNARWAEMSKREAVEATVRLLVEDVGAAQSFLDAIGVPYDLYDHGEPAAE